MRATQPNPVLEGISSGLGSFRNFLDALGNAKLPAPQGIPGIGHGMIGTAPEEIHEWASGFSPFSEEPNLGNRIDPRIKPGREQGVADIGFLVDGAAGLGLAGLRKGVRAAYPALNPEMNVSRREFMGNTGKAAAGLAAASVVPAALRGVEHAAPVLEHVAPSVAGHTAASVATHATPHEFFGAINSADRIAKAHHDAILAKAYDQEFDAAVKEGRINRERGLDTPYEHNHDEINKIAAKANNEALNRSIEVRERLVNQIKKDPKYVKYESMEDMLSNMPRNATEHEFDVAIAEWNKKHGILNESEIKAKLKSGEKYIDPRSGDEVVLNKNGELEYRDVETGIQGSNSYGVLHKKGAPKHFPEEHGIFDEVPNMQKNFYDTYAKHMAHTPAEKMQISKKAANENTRRAFQDAQKFDYLDDFTVEELRQLRDELSGDEFKRGGSVTMPNNYRMGGRVRMI
jgi:hypothetical protein